MKKLKIITFLFAFIFLFINSSFADNFQFLLRNSRSYISNSEVKVYNDKGLVYKDNTDRYGKISIDLDPGYYSVEIFFNDNRFVKKIQITGYSSGFKRIYLTDE